ISRIDEVCSLNKGLLSKIDLFLLTWRRAAKQGRLMIRLSDVKVRLQYRWRVRQRRGWQSAREAREGRGPDPSGDASALGTQSKAARHPGVAQATIARKTNGTASAADPRAPRGLAIP